MELQRLVVKLGTSLLTGGMERLDLTVMSSLVGQVAALHSQGREVIIVTSGAVTAGRQVLDMDPERKDTSFKQVLAAVGQSRLMNAYEQLFSWHSITVAQALLTRADLAHRASYLNARNTILALLELGVVPIINENDVVAAEELEGATFGDNDNLSAMVASLVDAELLAILTDTPGLCTADPHLDPRACLIATVEHIDERIEALALGSAGSGIGGMATKVQAAKLATAAGVTVVVADGREPGVLPRLVAGDSVGTRFVPTASRVEGRHRWLLASRTKGSLRVDDGAAHALAQDNKSLLPVGIKGVEGDFQRGEVVSIKNGRGKRIACGIVNYSAHELSLIRGAHSKKISATLGYEYGAEVMDRNNMVLL
ncbi:MAG: glutamate 5-kinase [Dehalococcoidia bacterium]|nr:glutamate 5-kinase [Dehalococcoidia bacterium]